MVYFKSSFDKENIYIKRQVWLNNEIFNFGLYQWKLPYNNRWTIEPVMIEHYTGTNWAWQNCNCTEMRVSSWDCYFHVLYCLSDLWNNKYFRSAVDWVELTSLRKVSNMFWRNRLQKQLSQVIVNCSDHQRTVIYLDAVIFIRSFIHSFIYTLVYCTYACLLRLLTTSRDKNN